MNGRDEASFAELIDAIRRIEDRLDGLETRVAGLDRRLHPLEDRVADVVTTVRDMRNGPGMGAAPIERAVMRLSERVQRMEDLVGVEEDEPFSQPSRGFFGRLMRRD